MNQPLNHNTNKVLMTFLPCYTIAYVKYQLEMTEFVQYMTFLLAYTIAVLMQGREESRR